MSIKILGKMGKSKTAAEDSAAAFSGTGAIWTSAFEFIPEVEEEDLRLGHFLLIRTAPTLFEPSKRDADIPEIPYHRLDKGIVSSRMEIFENIPNGLDRFLVRPLAAQFMDEFAELIARVPHMTYLRRRSFHFWAGRDSVDGLHACVEYSPIVHVMLLEWVASVGPR
jgi:hypothetical protein